MMEIYIGLAVTCICLIPMSATCMQLFCLTAARNLHRKTLHNLFAAPIQYVWYTLYIRFMIVTRSHLHMSNSLNSNEFDMYATVLSYGCQNLTPEMTQFFCIQCHFSMSDIHFTISYIRLTMVDYTKDLGVRLESWMEIECVDISFDEWVERWGTCDWEKGAIKRRMISF